MNYKLQTCNKPSDPKLKLSFTCQDRNVNFKNQQQAFNYITFPLFLQMAKRHFINGYPNGSIALSTWINKSQNVFYNKSFFCTSVILGGKALVIPIPVLYLGHSCSWLDVVNSLVWADWPEVLRGQPLLTNSAARLNLSNRDGNLLTCTPWKNMSFDSF